MKKKKKDKRPKNSLRDKMLQVLRRVDGATIHLHPNWWLGLCRWRIQKLPTLSFPQCLKASMYNNYTCRGWNGQELQSTIWFQQQMAFKYMIMCFFLLLSLLLLYFIIKRKKRKFYTSISKRGSEKSFFVYDCMCVFVS